MSTPQQACSVESRGIVSPLRVGSPGTLHPACSIRYFQPYRAVEREKIQAILEAARTERAVDHSVFSRRFTKTRLWDICIEYGCTTWSNLGGIASAIYGEPPSPKDRQHQVRVVVSAGMPRELWLPFEERFGVRILEWYGTMEGGAFAYNPPGVGPVGSFGKPPPVLEMSIVDDEDRPVPAGTIGELIGRPVGGSAQLDYFKNADASMRKTRGGWMHTGDMCWRDADGWFYFAHRKEEGGIRRMGEFISEGFVRRAVLEHPDVLDVHVYGVASRTGPPARATWW
jgi:acyl-CoA synthetase (AMP-forming)/AMP-acid ligase II